VSSLFLAVLTQWTKRRIFFGGAGSDKEKRTAAQKKRKWKPGEKLTVCTPATDFTMSQNTATQTDASSVNDPAAVPCNVAVADSSTSPKLPRVLLLLILGLPAAQKTHLSQQLIAAASAQQHDDADPRVCCCNSCMSIEHLSFDYLYERLRRQRDDFHAKQETERKRQQQMDDDERVRLNLPRLTLVPPSACRGPTRVSNWVFDGALCCGGYPSALDENEAEATAHAMAEAKFEVYVNLMQENELKRFRPYAEAIAARSKIQAEFIRYPIPDSGLPKDEEGFVSLIFRILSLLRAGKRIYIHCWGGHGRTGIVVSTLLAVLNPSWTAERAVETSQQLHSAGRKHKPNDDSPEIKQRPFVKRMVARIRDQLQAQRRADIASDARLHPAAGDEQARGEHKQDSDGPVETKKESPAGSAPIAPPAYPSSSSSSNRKFDPDIWRRSRVLAEQVTDEWIQLVHRSSSSRRHLLILDDNFFYRSMRFPFFRLARKHQVLFAQLEVRIDAEEAVKKNAERNAAMEVEKLRVQPPTLAHGNTSLAPPADSLLEASISKTLPSFAAELSVLTGLAAAPPDFLSSEEQEVTESTIRKMASVFQAVSCRGWEKTSLVVATGAEESDHGQQRQQQQDLLPEAIQFIANSWLSSPPPPRVAMLDPEAEASRIAAAREKTRESLLHALDLATRKMLNERVAAARSKGLDLKIVSKSWNDKRRALLAESRTVGSPLYAMLHTQVESELQEAEMRSEEGETESEADKTANQEQKHTESEAANTVNQEQNGACAAGDHGGTLVQRLAPLVQEFERRLDSEA
jgi:predicted protein tyrosine phosphatase